jgi:hypothetical protein
MIPQNVRVMELEKLHEVSWSMEHLHGADGAVSAKM